MVTATRRWNVKVNRQQHNPSAYIQGPGPAMVLLLPVGYDLSQRQRGWARERVSERARENKRARRGLHGEASGKEGDGSSRAGEQSGAYRPVFKAAIGQGKLKQ